MARPTSIRDFQAAQRGEMDGSGDLDGGSDGLATVIAAQTGIDPRDLTDLDDEPIEPAAADQIDVAPAANGHGHDYDINPDGTIKDWRQYAPRPTSGTATTDEDAEEEQRYSGAGADEEPTSENAQQASLFLVPGDAAFNGAQFRPAPELANIAEQLIGDNGFLSDLTDCKISYLWKRKTGVAKGKLKIGFLARGSGLLGHYSRSDFLVWLSASTARDAKFTDRQVEAAIFHQLCHISEDDNGNWIKIGHDFEGFASEVRIYGTWTEDLKIGGNAFKAAQQLGLDLNDVADDEDDEEDQDDGDADACDSDDVVAGDGAGVLIHDDGTPLTDDEIAEMEAAELEDA